MHSNLLLQAFKKAQGVISSEKPTHLSRHLSDFIMEDSGEPFGEKSLRNYYKNILENKGVNLKPFVVQSLCHYLGYASYEAYIVNVPILHQSKVPIQHRKKTTVVSQIFTVTIVVVFFIAFLLSFKGKRRPMGDILNEWQSSFEDHFYRMERLMKYFQGEAV